MAEQKKVKYRGFVITDEGHPVCGMSSVWVQARTSDKHNYLLVDGSFANMAGNGWYVDIAHAKQVINSITSAIHLGGE